MYEYFYIQLVNSNNQLLIMPYSSYQYVDIILYYVQILRNRHSLVLLWHTISLVKISPHHSSSIYGSFEHRNREKLCLLLLSEICYLLNLVYKKSSQNIHLRTISLQIVIVTVNCNFVLFVE